MRCFELLGGLGVLGQNPAGVAEDDFGLDFDEVRRIEPSLPEFVELFGGLPNADRARIGAQRYLEGLHPLNERVLRSTAVLPQPSNSWPDDPPDDSLLPSAPKFNRETARLHCRTSWDVTCPDPKRAALRRYAVRGRV